MPRGVQNMSCGARQGAHFCAQLRPAAAFFAFLAQILILGVDNGPKPEYNNHRRQRAGSQTKARWGFA